MNDFLAPTFGGLLFALICIAFMALRLRKEPSPYDERQLIAQGKGYKLAFFTLLSTLAVYSLYWSRANEAVLLPSMAILLCITAAVAVFACYCIIKDAYTPLTARPVLNVVLFSLFGVALTGISVFKLITFGAMENGHVGMPVCGLVLGGFALGLAAVLAVKTALDRKDNEDE